MRLALVLGRVSAPVSERARCYAGFTPHSVLIFFGPAAWHISGRARWALVASRAYEVIFSFASFRAIKATRTATGYSG